MEKPWLSYVTYETAGEEDGRGWLESKNGERVRGIRKAENEWYSSNNWECGTAGETIIIERNTILYTSQPAIKIRGNPADKVVVDGNIFKIGTAGDAIGQNGFCGWGDNITRPIDVRPNNVFGAIPSPSLPAAIFSATASRIASWQQVPPGWALSPVTLQWRYLNAMPERLSQLQLGKIDGDAVCDVAPRSRNPVVRPDRYSKSGTTPWQSLVLPPIALAGRPTPNWPGGSGYR